MLIFLKSSAKLAGIVTTWTVSFFVSLNRFKIYCHFYISMLEVFSWFLYLIFVEGVCLLSCSFVGHARTGLPPVPGVVSVKNT